MPRDRRPGGGYPALVQVAPITLWGRAVRVEPLERRHATELAAEIDHDSMRFMLDRPATRELAAVEDYLGRQIGEAGRVAFAIIDLESGRAAGSTSYMDIRPRHRGPGFFREGVLRRHMILPDGQARDTLMFSAVDSEWPAVRESLVLRLGYTP